MLAPEAKLKSKHLKGQLGPPVSDEKCLFVTKNDHFLKLCHEGQMEPPVSDEKFCFRAIHREQIQKKIN